MVRGSFSRFLTSSSWFAAAAVLVLSGCSGIGIQAEVAGAATEEPKPGVTGIDAGMSPSHVNDTGADSASDAGVGTPPRYPTGMSPLCLPAINAGCDPDSWACVNPVDGEGGGASGSDAGAGMGDGGAGAETGAPLACASGSSCNDAADHVACRVGGPVCSSQNFTQNAEDGVSCKVSSDCDIGFECVGGAGPYAGTCKRYCCSGSCAVDPGSSGPVPFCDIEPTISGQPAAGVPVCTTAPSCTPLTDTCGPGLTCTVVSESGQTACVTYGKAQAREDCTSQKCAANLACIQGTCLALCDTHSAEACPADETCFRPTAFGSDGDIGVCTP